MKTLLQVLVYHGYFKNVFGREINKGIDRKELTFFSSLHHSNSPTECLHFPSLSRQLAQHLSVKVTHIYNSDNVLSLGAIEQRGKLLSATQRTLVCHFYCDNIRFHLMLS